MAKISQSSAFAATQEIGVQTHSQPAYSRPSRRETFWKDVSKKLRIVIHYKRKPISCTWHRNTKKKKSCVGKNRSLRRNCALKRRNNTTQITKLCKNKNQYLKKSKYLHFIKDDLHVYPPKILFTRTVRINSSVSRVTSGTLYSRIGFLHDTSTSSQPHQVVRDFLQQLKKNRKKKVWDFLCYYFHFYTWIS